MTCIIDKDHVIASSGNAKKPLMEKNISPELEQIIEKRATVLMSRKDNNFIPILEGEEEIYNYEIISPIISEGDVLGAVVMLSIDKEMGELESKLVQTVAGFLGKQMEQ